ncbi:Proline iminopeptidase [Penicillium hispanicum]|uniref:Proline iminopeptidase n=1 Tax=Penicillium hispanicum TaxID=1080232 RepID=UPI00254102BC|nr:Proline iminopeptidase [Penicillium hispanicum]KAJ5585599.1 Proline iminopeptidase [Penicillium hispanicum]
MSRNSLDPGLHSFTAAEKQLTFEYVVHRPSTADGADSLRNLIVVQCPGWGLGSQYLQVGLADLWQPSPEINEADSVTRFTVLFFHPRGTDGSSRPRSANEMRSMPDLASDLEDLRQHLQLEKYPILLGHSNGGAIALGYAEMYPSRVNRLVLLNHQVVGIQDRQMARIEATDSNPVYRGAWEALLKHRTDTDDEFTASIRGMWPLYFYDPERYTDELLDAIGDRKLSVWCYQSQGRCDCKLESPMQMVERMGHVQAKTLIIFGYDDMICGMGIARRTMADIPIAQIVAYQQCGHFPWIEQKRNTIRDIRLFIDGELD